MTSCDTTRLDLGAYALGTLEPADQRAVDAHLTTCAACRAEVAEFRAVLPALAALDAGDLTRPEPSPDLFARIADAVQAAEPARSPSRWQPRRLLTVAASVVVIAGAAAGIGIAVSSSDGSGPASSVASAQAGAVRLHVTATDAGQGTRLVLTAQGLPNHERCRLVAVAADGTRHEAGSWNADYEGEAQVVESTAVRRSDLRQLVLYGTTGQHLLTVDV